MWPTTVHSQVSTEQNSLNNGLIGVLNWKSLAQENSHWSRYIILYMYYSVSLLLVNALHSHWSMYCTLIGQCAVLSLVNSLHSDWPMVWLVVAFDKLSLVNHCLLFISHDELLTNGVPTLFW